MNKRITHTIQQRRTGVVGIVYVVDADEKYLVAQQTCASEAEALAWASAKVEEIKQEIRQ